MEHHTNPAKLSDQERAEMQRSFVAFMEANPVVPASPKLIHSPFFLPLLRIPSLVVTAFLIVGGTTIAAEQSLPDDFLYPLKTEVIEPLVIESHARTPEAKARASQTLVNRRLDEAATIVERKRANATSVAKLAIALEEHTGNVENYVRDARNEGRLSEALSIGSTLENVLEAHGEIIEIIANDDAFISSEEQELIEAVADSADDAEESSEDIEEEVSLTESAESEGYVTETDEKVRESIEEVLADISDQVETEDTELVKEARTLLKDSQSAQETAIMYLSEGQRGAALPHLRRALQNAEQAAILLDSHEEFEND